MAVCSLKLSEAPDQLKVLMISVLHNSCPSITYLIWWARGQGASRWSSFGQVFVFVFRFHLSCSWLEERVSRNPPACMTQDWSLSFFFFFPLRNRGERRDSEVAVFYRAVIDSLLSSQIHRAHTLYILWCSMLLKTCALVEMHRNSSTKSNLKKIFVILVGGEKKVFFRNSE